MIRGVFPRLFGFFREGAILTGKWNIGASGAVTAVAADTHNDLVLTRSIAGTYTLKVTGGCRRMQVIDLRYIGLTAPTTIASLRRLAANTVFVPGSTGFGFVVLSGVTNAIEEGTNGDQIHATIYVDR